MRLKLSALVGALLLALGVGAARPTTRPSGFIVQMQTFELPADAVGKNPADLPMPPANAKVTSSIEAMAYPDHDYLARQTVGTDVDELSGSVKAASDGKSYRVAIDWKHDTGGELRNTRQLKTSVMLLPDQPMRTSTMQLAGGGGGLQMIVALKTAPSGSIDLQKPNHGGGGASVREVRP